jgi:uncharacterized protein YuzB (UPF0349 family)
MGPDHRSGPVFHAVQRKAVRIRRRFFNVGVVKGHLEQLHKARGGLAPINRPTMQRRRMQICSSNVLSRRPDIVQQMKEMGYVVETESCLDHCTRCEKCALALVCGRMIFARTPEEFVRKLR